MTSEEITAIIFFGLILGPIALMIVIMCVTALVLTIRAFCTVIWGMLQDLWQVIREG